MIAAETPRTSDLERPVDALFLLSHVAIALLAALAFEAVSHLAWYFKAILMVAYVILAYVAYTWVKSKASARVQTAHELEVRSARQELGEWRRFELLQQRMLAIVAQFLKERYQVVHHLVSKLDQLNKSGEVTERALEGALEDFDKERRVQIKRALEQISSFLTEDDYLRPESAGRATVDLFKVTFYAVQRLGEDGNPNAAGTEFLVPKARAIPNEGEPRTRRFKKGEGASGTAWATKKIVVCELGGKETVFKDMWDGGGQKAAYKSMICVPVIEDIPSEALSDVYGILTVDTPVREGYFANELDAFWATLHQPICNLLIYCRESERLKTAIVSSMRKVIEQQHSKLPLGSHDDSPAA